MSVASAASPEALRRAAAGRPARGAAAGLPRRQRGLTLVTLIFVGLIAVVLLIIGFRVVPALAEYFAIDRAVQRVAHEGSTVREIRAAFDRYATIDDIHSIGGKDLDITKDGDEVVVGYHYSYPVQLSESVRLVIDFAGTNRDRPNHAAPP